MCFMLINFIQICETFYTAEKRIPRSFNIHFSIVQYIKVGFTHVFPHGFLTIQTNIHQFVCLTEAEQLLLGHNSTRKHLDQIRLSSVTVYLLDALCIFHSVTQNVCSTLHHSRRVFLTGTT